MNLKTTLFGQTYQFRDVKDVLAKANELRSGDVLAGVAAETAQERVAAKQVLSEMRLETLRENPVVPYEEDAITRVIQDAVNKAVYEDIKHWTVSELREYILSDVPTREDYERLRRGLTSEMVAAVCKYVRTAISWWEPRSCTLFPRPIAPSAFQGGFPPVCSQMIPAMISTALWFRSTKA